MKISVIIPFVNRDELLKRCLDSIDSRFEVIAVEDESRLGPSATRNEGLNRAFNYMNYQPDYITFLDADDFMLPEAYDNMVAAIKQDRSAQIIQFNHKRQMQDGTVYTRFFNADRVHTIPSVPSLWVNVWNKLYKADLIENIRFIPGLNHGEDELFNLECLHAAEKMHSSSMFTVMHCFDNPRSLSKTTTFTDLIREQKELIDFLDCHSFDNGIHELIRKRQLELWDNPTYKSIFSKRVQ